MGKLSANPTDYVDEYNGLIYIINSIISNRVRGAEIVKVIANNGDGTIDVLPVIKNVDASENAIQETPIFNIKYMEWQYGINAFQAEPAIGDIGLLIVCTKDTKNVKSGIVGDLGSFELESGIYFGGLKGLNQPATQFIKMDENGITITTPKTLTVNTTENAIINATKSVTVTATEDATINGVNVTVNASTKANVVAPTVNLGAEGGVAVAKDGDEVVMGTTVVGTIKASSTVVKTI